MKISHFENGMTMQFCTLLRSILKKFEWTSSLPQFQPGIWSHDTASTQVQRQALWREVKPTCTRVTLSSVLKTTQALRSFLLPLYSLRKPKFFAFFHKPLPNIVDFCSVLPFIFISQKLLSVFHIIRTQGFHQQCTWTFLSVQNCMFSVHLQVLGWTPMLKINFFAQKLWVTLYNYAFQF